MTGHAALARANFETGCNCAQAVLCAYPELLPRETAMKLGASLGGGIGRLRGFKICVFRFWKTPTSIWNDPLTALRILCPAQLLMKSKGIWNELHRRDDKSLLIWHLFVARYFVS